jgi:hypothetical protein
MASGGVAIGENTGVILDTPVWPEIIIAATHGLILKGVPERLSRAANSELFWRIGNLRTKLGEQIERAEEECTHTSHGERGGAHGRPCPAAAVA